MGAAVRAASLFVRLLRGNHVQAMGMYPAGKIADQEQNEQADGQRDTEGQCGDGAFTFTVVPDKTDHAEEQAQNDETEDGQEGDFEDQRRHGRISLLKYSWDCNVILTVMGLDK